MVKVITYGTYDLLHYGHIKLLERAKALGDYLIVGVTADDFDKTRGKINVQQSLMERIESVSATGLADEIIALIKDVNRRKGMGKSAYREAEKYLPESIIRQWETLFENLTTI